MPRRTVLGICVVLIVSCSLAVLSGQRGSGPERPTGGDRPTVTLPTSPPELQIPVLKDCLTCATNVDLRFSGLQIPGSGTGGVVGDLERCAIPVWLESRARLMRAMLLKAVSGDAAKTQGFKAAEPAGCARRQYLYYSDLLWQLSQVPQQ